MSKKLFSFGIAILALLISVKSANANPRSCKASAITSSEKKSVIILDKMYDLQIEMSAIDKKLDKLNIKQSLGYNSYDTNSVNRYNELINSYNSVTREKNILSDEFNTLRASFNKIVAQSSVSSNVLFVNCLNTAVMGIDLHTNSLNLNSSSLSIKSMNLEAENMMRNLNNLNY